MGQPGNLMRGSMTGSKARIRKSPYHCFGRGRIKLEPWQGYSLHGGR